MSETTSAPTAATAPAEAVTETKPVELVTLYHPTIPDVVTPPLPPEQVEDALRQGWVRTPPGAEQLAEVEIETGSPVESTGTPLPPEANAPAAVTPPVSTEKPGRSPRA